MLKWFSKPNLGFSKPLLEAIMATNAYMQFPPSVETLKVRATPTLQYAVAAAALGMVFGATIAATLVSMPNLSGTTDSASAPAVVVTAPPAAQTLQASTVQGKTDKQAIAKPASTLVTPAANKSAAPIRHSYHSMSARMRFVASLKGSPHRALVAPHSSASLKLASLPAVKPADVVKPYSFFVEGDVTIADYDATTGKIETNDGRSFTIDTTVDASNAKAPADYFGSVHYRCDQGGNCSLKGGGVMVPSAKMTS